ncbi:hypothetical protein CAPTEDRAFT_206416 [Capitella teleta]|uniref:Thioredoxin domain-containing protein n=1 Tax=Capitella teleta TaxID=283909 RepID=R7T9C0_CAPTE|nr:hypothetical protein CAPTEDRAFT_206416 [Capitella teleta]|eukprot:ELT90043.1 hypothetical protein CAPTEDRAFT_206416 [Capitella teleta]
MGKIKEVECADDFYDIRDCSGGKLVVADFWAAWCGPCRLIGPTFEKMANEAEYKDVIFVKVDVDENGELAEEYEIQVMPTFLFFKDGEKIDEMAGSNKEKLVELVQTYK